MVNATAAYGRATAAVQNGGEGRMQLLNNPFTTPSVRWKIQVNNHSFSPPYYTYQAGQISYWNSESVRYYWLNQNIQDKEESNESNLCR